MGDSKILLGRHHFLYYRDTKIHIAGWTFTLPENYLFIAGGNDEATQTLISIYRESEKIAQLSLTHEKSQVNLVIQAISSEVTIEISEYQRMVAVVEKN